MEIRGHAAGLTAATAHPAKVVSAKYQARTHRAGEGPAGGIATHIGASVGPHAKLA
jgi:hypothetical protein